MKKTLLFAAATLVLAGNMQAQSLQFVDNGKVLEDGAQVTVYHYDEIFGSMEWMPVIHNTTDQDINVTLMVDVTSNPDESDLQLCVDGVCLAPWVTETDLTILADKDCEDFHAQFYPNGEQSKAVATYYLVSENEEIITKATVTYDYPAYVAGVSSATVSSQLKMIQNGNNITCRYAFDKTASRQVVITSIVGTQVASFPLNNNSGEVQLGKRLAKGIYVYTLIENGRNVKSHKIIIR